ncbi:MAG: FAD:protein transferase [Methanolobus sp.]|jgi:thiamine biosynthesis lipoprotein|uniref:FAD:protein FMN transferase n=1 Tax=Methanolobus sp. TaxID=1874737 RepID=UPI0024AB73A0|nr:FAD:protein FMN transferase [Methanolobus sp.]MDI3487260.1 FAD:protein transferase [Methanolobus sp.]MDK2825569.1 FAD:protein transferase [Methanolobus sp.]MDK2832837.1 FAD:protein transferase [Methanolobus sp.]MDK2938414.1 FAD:protein transferase [Methanolobus sp.]MDK2947344.1 FAD:protein transferase [Methanolobus sp.]
MRYKTVAIVLIAVFTGLLMINYVQDMGSHSLPEQQIYSQTRSLMDTTVTITVVSSNETSAIEIIDNAFEKIKYVDELMNNYDNSSEISILNKDDKVTNADPELVSVIDRSIYYSEKSNGAFDISIQPILDLWASKYAPGGTNQPPTSDEINQTLKLVNYSAIIVEGNNVSMKEGMKITLGGVAKGYAVDVAIESLKSDGISSGFVNAGGDGRYIGTKPDGSLWRVGLQNPDKSGDAVTIMNIRDVAVATSGNYERYFSDEAKVSHIADPRTGYPSSNLISSTVIAKTAMDADALATSVFILGEKDGLAMIEKLDGVECLIITNDKKIIRSSGFSSYESN